MNIERKSFLLEVKETGDAGQFTGYASVFGNEDSDGDVVVKGAFANTLKKSGGEVPILWQHDTKQPIGLSSSMVEDEHGLLVKGTLALDVPQAKSAFALLKLGAIKGLSIGYQVVRDSISGSKRLLKEINLLEFSIVTFPANTLAEVTSVKAVVPFQDLPLADGSRGWDAGAARGRVKAWAGGDDVDPAKYKRAFLWFDNSKPDDLTSYKFPIADVSGGKLVAIPKAIFSAAGAINGARGGTDIPASDISGMKAHLNRYYNKLGKDSPFGDKSMTTGFKAADFNDQLETADKLSDLYDQRYKMDRALSDAISGICDDGSMNLDDKKAACSESFDQHNEARKAWHGKYLDLTQDEPDEDDLEGKSGRMISGANVDAMKDAIAHHQQALDMSKDAMKMHRKGISAMLSILAYAGQYQADRNAPNPVGSPKSAASGGTEELHSLTDALRKTRDAFRVS